MINSFSTLRLGSGCPEHSRMGKVLNVKLKFFSLLLVLIITLLTINSAQAISNKLNYQGRLLDKSGNVVSKTISVKFSIYDVETGGSALWTETKDITITNGYFSTVLGDTTVLGLDFTSDNYYLGVKFGSDSEMSPRKYIGAAPFAINTSKINGSSLGTGVNNILKLGNTGNIDIQGEIKTAGALNAGTSTLANLTVSGTTNIAGSWQLGGTTINASADEINVLDDGINFTEIGGTATDGQISDTITASNYLPLAGGTLTGNLVFSGAQTIDGVDISTIPSTYLALSGGTLSGAIDMGNSNITNVAQLALTPRSDGTTTEGDVYYDSDTDAFYGRTAADWVNFAGDGGDITSVTAGNGLTGGGVTGDVTLNIVAGDGTITTNADSIVVGSIESSNITDGAITAADLGADSVDASELSSTAIVFGDIEAGDLPAAIDATKIGGGTIDNTEFSYLNNVSSAIQTQFTGKYSTSGGQLTGDITFSGAQTVDGVDISSISTTYLALAGGTLTGDLAITTSDFDVTLGATDGASFTSNAAATVNALTVTAATATDGVAGLYVDMSDNSTTGFVNGIDVNLDVDTALLAAGRARGINVDVAGNAADNASSSVMGIRLNGDATVTGGTLVGLNYNGTWDYGIYLNNGSTYTQAEIKLSGGGTSLSGETIANTYDGMIDFGGVGGTDNSDLRLDLDGTMPVISSVTDSAVGFDDNISFTGAQTVDGVDVSTIPTTYIQSGSIASSLVPQTDNSINLGSLDSVWQNGYFTNLLAGTGDSLTITANAASTWSTSAGQLSINGAAGVSMNAGTGNYYVDPGTIAWYDFDPASYMYLNAPNNTSQAGVLDMNVTTATTNNIGINLTYQPDGSGGDKSFSAMKMSLQASNIESGDTLYGLNIVTPVGSSVPNNYIFLNQSAGTGTVIDGIRITSPLAGGNYADGISIDSGGGSFTNGLHINSYGATATFTNGILIDSSSGTITNGLNVSGSNITYGINLGANMILGTTSIIDFNNFDVSADGAMTLTGKITNTNYTGSDFIANGQTSKTVSTTYISASDKIFISFTAQPGGYWWVNNIVNATSFDVDTSGACVGICSFDYWIVK